MQLSLHDQLTLTAFGLIATRMPDGSRGYSLIVFITAEDFRPIPLGMGFTLLGIGGMVAINRTFDQDVLRAGPEERHAGHAAVPARSGRQRAGDHPRRWPTAFPARRGSYLLGILAKIGWFTPTLVMLRPGADPRVRRAQAAAGARPHQRAAALARQRPGAPQPRRDRACSTSTRARRRSTRCWSTRGWRTSSRSPARRRCGRGWGSGPGSSFVLAVGGFNPRFAPPAGLPTLARIAIALSSGNNPRLTCEAYFAITANTVQFGARAPLYAAAYGFSVEGDIGFDVLIAARAAALHRRLPRLGAAQARLAQPVQGVGRTARSKGRGRCASAARRRSRSSGATSRCASTRRWSTASRRRRRRRSTCSPSCSRRCRPAQSWSTQTPPTRRTAWRCASSRPARRAGARPARAARGQAAGGAAQHRRATSTLFGGAPVAGARRFHVGAALQAQSQNVAATLQAPFAPAQYFA